mmetsp:Transcript_20297/g.40262  ORF Transcript_20297/g.40262 Transcript_20297/m.40262 type:complete len:301 (-) Transcript_20297:150-1052(-)
MQLAVDVQIPEAFNGVGGECIYIDTEGSFMVERALQMSGSVATHLGSICRHSSRPAQVEAAAELADNPEAFLRGIHVMRVHDHTEQLAAVANLPALLKENPKVRLVVIDSIAFHFRHGVSSVDFGKRARLLTSMAQKLNELAHKQSVAVVLMNQMTTKVEAGGGGGSRLVPALGESWAHAATHRLTLFWARATAARSLLVGQQGGEGALDNNPERLAKLIKSSCKAEGVVRYTVNAKGVRDVGRPSRAPRPQSATVASSSTSSLASSSSSQWDPANSGDAVGQSRDDLAKRPRHETDRFP